MSAVIVQMFDDGDGGGDGVIEYECGECGGTSWSLFTSGEVVCEKCGTTAGLIVSEEDELVH